MSAWLGLGLGVGLRLGVGLEALGGERLALVLVAVEEEHIEAGRPVLELALPVGERRLGSEHEEGAAEAWASVGVRVGWG